MMGDTRTPAAMSAVPMAMGCCWREINQNQWKIEVELLVDVLARYFSRGRSRDAPP